MKPKIQIIDTNMAGDRYRITEEPSCIWEWNSKNKNYPITVFTDSELVRASEYNSKIKIGILLEPPTVNQSIYDFISENYGVFDEVITFVKGLTKIDKRIIFCPFGSTWISPENRKLWNKNKNVSMIASSKNYAPGHKIRHDCAKFYKNKIDLMGGGYRPIKGKDEGLFDYRFSLAIENSILDDYFTEKLIDCFATGVIPIYWGCKSIGNYFNRDGMITFSNPEELKDILDDISEEHYRSKLPAIEHNLHEVKRYSNIYENYYNVCLKKYL